MRWPVALFLPILGIIGLRSAEADEPVYPSAQAVRGSARPAPPQQPPAPHPVPVPTVADRCTDADRFDHLRKAAGHLQAAGLNSLANHIHGLSHTARNGRPPKDTRSIRAPAQVLLHVKLLELDKEGLRRSGLDFSQTQLLRKLPGLNGLVETLQKEGLVRVLAEPTLVTVIGRPARFHSGGEVLLWNIGPDGEPVQRPKLYGIVLEQGVARRLGKW